MGSLDFSTAHHEPGSAASCLSELRRWRRSNPQNKFAEFLKLHPGLGLEVLLELATTDLINQIAADIPARADDYINASSRLAKRNEYVLDLIDAELCARTDKGETLSRSELTNRFRGLDAKVNRLFDVHQLDLEASESHEFATPNKPSLGLETFAQIKMIGDYELLKPVFANHEYKYWLAKKCGEAEVAAESNEDQVILFWFTLPEDSSLTENGRARLCEDLIRFQSFSHPNWQPVFDTGIAEDHVYVALKTSPGHLLGTHLLGNQKASDSKTVGTMLLKAIRAIQSLANAQVSVYGLRSNDILMESEEPRLLDFGLAHLVKRHCDKSEQQAETVATISSGIPLVEQLREMGMLIFSILLGDSDTEELEQHLGENHVAIRLQDIDEGIAKEFDDIYLACTNPKANQRYPSIESLADDLERLEKGKRLTANKLRRSWF